MTQQKTYALIKTQIALDEGYTEFQSAKEHDAPWLKNATSVFRDAGGRFTSKSGGSSGLGKQMAEIGDTLKEIGDAAISLPQAGISKVLEAGSATISAIKKIGGESAELANKVAQAIVDNTLEKACDFLTRRLLDLEAMGNLSDKVAQRGFALTEDEYNAAVTATGLAALVCSAIPLAFGGSFLAAGLYGILEASFSGSTVLGSVLATLGGIKVLKGGIMATVGGSAMVKGYAALKSSQKFNRSVQKAYEKLLKE